MILDEIVLHNFSVYLGRQSVILTPPSGARPIVLIGGLNGEGKTSLLDALQLSLFGKFAVCSSRGSLSYEEFLVRSIHRSVPLKEGAGLTLRFRHSIQGKEHSFVVQRSWSKNGSAVKERLGIIRDGKLDKTLTDAWDEYVEVFLPLRISHLFFFDGEKIKDLADPEQCSKLLMTGVQSLLGLDLVDRLVTDLTALETREKISLRKHTERQQIELLRTEKKHFEDLRDDLARNRALAQNELDQLRRALENIENRFIAHGGGLLNRHQEIENEHAKAEDDFKKIEEELQEFASGIAPFLLVRDLLADIEEQDRIEEASIRAELLGNLLESRDSNVIQQLRALGGSEDQIQSIGALLARDRRERAEATGVKRYLGLSEEARIWIRNFEKSLLPETVTQANRLLQLAEELQSAVIDAERKVASIPDEDELRPLIDQREQILESIKEVETRIRVLDLELERNRQEIGQKEIKLTRQIRSGS